MRTTANKSCNNCNENKPVDDFSPHKGGLNSICKPCAAQKSADYRERMEREFPDRFKEMKRKHKRQQHLKKNYGLSIQEFGEMVAARSNRCDICGRSSTLLPDHDHSNGRLRGLLCYACNNGIGMLGDTYSAVEKALRYLEKGYS